MKYLIALSLLFTSMAQAELLSSPLPYNNYQDWRQSDQLFYSTFNVGEQWKDWSGGRSTVEPLNLVDQINLCYQYNGGWNHLFNECVIEDEAALVNYLEATEEAERFGFHFSAPTQIKEVDEDLASLDPEQLDWNNYSNWSPQQQLYFSTLSQSEQDGEIVPWTLD